MKNTQQGVLKVELLVSCIVLMTTMTFVVPLCFRINLIWKDVTQHQIAVNELANQLETLTRLPLDQLPPKIENLTPSDTCTASLPQSVLVGKIQKDNLGTRIELSLDWKRFHGGRPIELAGWIVEPENSVSIEESVE